jgi:hypothetical protein
MLAMRPNCECCNRDLPADKEEAMICSFECTFCVTCAKELLGERCPNCGGKLVLRPLRSSALLEQYPATTQRVLKPKGCPAETRG